MPCAISLHSRSCGVFLIKFSTDCWYLRISFNDGVVSRRCLVVDFLLMEFPFRRANDLDLVIILSQLFDVLNADAKVLLVEFPFPCANPLDLVDLDMLLDLEAAQLTSSNCSFLATSIMNDVV